jgi:trans-aconitate methyltransferase
MNAPRQSPVRKSNPYEAWAELLQLWERFGSNTDIPFYVNLARASAGPVVELGVGWGRLAEQVRPDVGIDYADRMLAAARERLAGQAIELVQADLEDYRLEQPAGFSYAAMNSFDHITDHDSLTRIFRNIRLNTAPGGRFAFDAEVHTPQELRDSSYMWGLDGFDAEIAIHSSMRVVDAEAMTYEVVAAVEWLDDDGYVVSRRYFPALPGRAVSTGDYTRLFEATGWQVVDAWGGFADEPMDRDSRHQVWLLEAA